jgi:hypothetical protein
MTGTPTDDDSAIPEDDFEAASMFRELYTTGSLEIDGTTYAMFAAGPEPIGRCSLDHSLLRYENTEEDVRICCTGIAHHCYIVGRRVE